MADTPRDDTPRRSFDAEIAAEDRIARKEDYKAYAERDLDEGWPYSDSPAGEDDRLKGNRPYAAEEVAPVDEAEEAAESGGWHIDEPDPAAGDGLADEEAADTVEPTKDDPAER